MNRHNVRIWRTEISRAVIEHVRDSPKGFVKDIVFVSPLTADLQELCHRITAAAALVNHDMLECNQDRVCSQSCLTVIVSSTELVSIVLSRNMFAFSSEERAFNIESYFRTGRIDGIVYALSEFTRVRRNAALLSRNS
ncbi:hypothetical protein ANN_18905 [Periplaneta americana]|uniref:Uncharacterized protein n=1 Tax=Periplaneta americana TaxID=6978 RepID=A0ABQ8SQ15_PERAM|nr:hypothetical protein ANN_18905 [Periplaneta americana]